MPTIQPGSLADPAGLTGFFAVFFETDFFFPPVFAVAFFEAADFADVFFGAGFLPVLIFLDAIISPFSGSI
jgi:hypothetical protein